MQTSTLSWYIARAAGLTAWSLASAAVIWGLLISSRASAFGRRPRPAWTLDLHRYLGGLAAVFTAIHVAGILADPWLHLGAVAAIIPFVSAWQPAAVAWGIAAMYLLVAVELTSLARSRLPRRVWRAVHFASFPLFLTATVHAFTAGSDTGSILYVLLATCVVLAIAALTGLRVREALAPRPARSAGGGRRPAPAPSALAGVVSEASQAARHEEVLV